jgi:hypothetical protein
MRAIEVKSPKIGEFSSIFGGETSIALIIAKP